MPRARHPTGRQMPSGRDLSREDDDLFARSSELSIPGPRSQMKSARVLVGVNIQKCLAKHIVRGSGKGCPLLECLLLDYMAEITTLSLRLSWFANTWSAA